MAPFFPRISFPRYRIPVAEFKGHHVKALKKINHLAPQIDLVLELRDSRAPISTQNVLFDRSLAQTPRIVLYSKNDSSGLDPKMLANWHQNQQFMMVDCRSRKSANHIVEMARNFYRSMVPSPPLGLRMLVIGMPNVGKSTLVNTLRDVGLSTTKKVAKTGGMAGVTRSTSEIIRISSNPGVLLYDTPGVSLPRTSDYEQMIVLALAGSVGPTFVDPVIQADYLLYVMNLQDPEGGLYRKFLRKPTNNIEKLLMAVFEHMTRNKPGVRKQAYNEKGAAIYWVDRWRQGKEGKIIFDKLAIKRYTDFVDKHVDHQQLEQAERERVDGLNIALNRPREDSKSRFVKRQNMLFK